MRKLIAIAFSGLAFTAMADDWAEIILTPSIGRLEIVSDYLLFSSGKNYEARIPKEISSGTKIRVSYNKDGNWVEHDFVVAAISTKDELCRLHDKVPSQYSSSPGNTIYIKPCRYR